MTIRYDWWRRREMAECIFCSVAVCCTFEKKLSSLLWWFWFLVFCFHGRLQLLIDFECDLGVGWLSGGWNWFLTFFAFCFIVVCDPQPCWFRIGTLLLIPSSWRCVCCDLPTFSIGVTKVWNNSEMEVVFFVCVKKYFEAQCEARLLADAATVQRVYLSGTLHRLQNGQSICSSCF